MGYGVPVSGKDRTPSSITQQDMREKHFAPFLAAIRAGALSVMVNSAMNNGLPFHEEEIVEPAEVVVETIEVVEEKPVEVVIPVPEKKANTEKVYKEEKIIEKPSEKEVIEETKKEVETVKASEENEIFTLHKPEFVSKINIIGQIDLATLNQSTRPKKKTKEEKRKEREEKEKLRQDQKKLMYINRR